MRFTRLKYSWGNGGSTNRLGGSLPFRGVFVQLCLHSGIIKRGRFHKSPSEQGFWGGNLTLFADLNGYLVRFCIKVLGEKGDAVELGETLMQWLSLLINFITVPTTKAPPLRMFPCVVRVTILTIPIGTSIILFCRKDRVMLVPIAVVTGNRLSYLIVHSID